MIVKKSSKLNSLGEFWHDERMAIMQRVWGGVGLHGSYKFAVVLGEESFAAQNHYHVIAEAQTERDDSVADLLATARTLEKTFGVKRWMARVDANVEQVLAIHNRSVYNTGVSNLILTDTPRIGEYIDEHVAAIHMLTKAHDKRLHFYGESMLPGEIKNLLTVKNRADEYPGATALSSVLTAMLQSGHDNISPADLIPKPEGLY